jgi:hypothetical protein
MSNLIVLIVLISKQEPVVKDIELKIICVFNLVISLSLSVSVKNADFNSSGYTNIKQIQQIQVCHYSIDGRQYFQDFNF